MVVLMTYAANGQRRRGRPPRISRDDIVDAACELGIEDLTMAAVAERLGVTHQSLYGWVQDRDELIDLVSDRLIRRLEIQSPSDPADWRDSLRSYANGLRRLAEEMPGFAAAGLGRFRVTEGFVKLNHAFVLMLIDVGFEPPMAQRIYESVNSVLLGWLTRDEALSAVRRTSPAGPHDVASSLLMSDLAEGEIRSPSDERFEFLIHSFLAGMPDPLAVRLAPATAGVVDVRDHLVAQGIGAE
jgi:AcrR family transcriptional regulator